MRRFKTVAIDGVALMLGLGAASLAQAFTPGAQAEAITMADTYQSMDDHHRLHRVVIPTEDRFIPFATTIDVGDAVQWTNTDTDDHTVVSDDVFNTADHHGVNHVIPGTDSNSGQPGKFTLRFNEPGVFVYHCRFHSHLDVHNQPVAPGPDGGIQDTNGNFGTPMMGVITVLGGDN